MVNVDLMNSSIYWKKIDQSAKLAGVVGSVERRCQVARELGSKFANFVDDKLQNQGFITSSDIIQINKNLAPNVDFTSVIQAPKYKGVGGSLPYLMHELFNRISGYRMELSFSDKMSLLKQGDSENVAILFHEEDHFLRAITEPKFAIAYFKDGMEHDFYESVLYGNEIKELPRAQKKILKQNESQRISFVENQINKLFDSKHLTSEQKIVALKKWRICMKNELLAFNTQEEAYVKYKYQTKEIAEKLKSGTNPVVLNYGKGLKRHFYISALYRTPEKREKILDQFALKAQEYSKNRSINQTYFFPQKINLIEKMLAAEIAKTRSVQKTRFENQDLLNY